MSRVCADVKLMLELHRLENFTQKEYSIPLQRGWAGALDLEFLNQVLLKAVNNSYINIIHLTEWPLWELDSKPLYKLFPFIVKLFETNRKKILTVLDYRFSEEFILKAEQWKDVDIKKFFRYVILVESQLIFSENKFLANGRWPFKITRKEYVELFSSIYAASKGWAPKSVQHWINAGYIVPKEDSVQFELEVLQHLISKTIESDQKFSINLAPFLKSKKTLKCLTKIFKTPDFSNDDQDLTFELDIAELDKTEMQFAFDFFNTVPNPSNKVIKLYWSDAERLSYSNQLYDFFQGIQNKELSKITVINVQTNVSEVILIDFLEKLKSITWVSDIQFKNCLNNFTDKALMRVIQTLSNNDNLTYLYLYGNGIIHRNFETLEAIVHQLNGSNALREKVLWSQEETREIKPTLSEVSKFSLASIEMQLKPESVENCQICEWLPSQDLFNLIFKHYYVGQNDIILYWVRRDEFNDEKCLALANLCIEGRRQHAGYLMDFPLKDFVLPEQNNLELYLIDAPKIGLLEYGLYGLYNRRGADAPLFNAWQDVGALFFTTDMDGTIETVSIDADNYFEQLKELDWDSYYAALKEKVLPKLEAACQTVWPNHDFYQLCLNSMRSFDLENENKFAKYAWAAKAHWFTWSMAYLTTLDITQLDKYDRTFKALLDYPDSERRYTITYTLFTKLLSNEVGQSIYRQLIESPTSIKKEDRGPRHLIPEIFLTQILLNYAIRPGGEVKENSEFQRLNVVQKVNYKPWMQMKNAVIPLKHVQLARNILNNFSNMYEQDQNLQVLVNTLQQLADAPGLTAQQKCLVIYHAALTKQDAIREKLNLYNQSFLQNVDFIDFLSIKKEMKEIFGATLWGKILPTFENKFGDGFNYERFLQESLVDQLKRSTVNVVKKCIEKRIALLLPNEECFELRLQRYKKSLKTQDSFQLYDIKNTIIEIFGMEFWQDCELDIEKIYCPKAANVKQKMIAKKFKNTVIRWLKQEAIEICHQEDIQSQIRNWHLIMGFCLFGELRALAGVSYAKYESVSAKLFVKHFALEPLQREHCSQVLTTFKDSSAILVYLDKLKSIGNTRERNSLVQEWMNIIQSLFSNNSELFYKTRYNIALNPHLRTIFTRHPDLKKNWINNRSLGFNAFLEENQIYPKKIEPNIIHFIQQCVLQYHSNSALECLELKEYIDNLQDDKVRADLKQCAVQKAGMLGVSLPLIFMELLDSFETAKNQSILHAEAQDPLEKAKALNRKYISYVKIALKQLRIVKHEALERDLQKLLESIEDPLRSIDRNKTKHHRIVLTDNFWDIFMSGTDIIGSCQHVDGNPEQNKCLLAFLKDGKNKLLAIQDETGKTTARCFLRLLWDEVSGRPVLFMENFYPSYITSEEKQALIQFACHLADELNCVLVSSHLSADSTRYPNPIVSIGGTGLPEYVDALYDIVQDGKFSIKNAQVIHTPKNLQQLHAVADSHVDNPKNMMPSISPMVSFAWDSVSANNANVGLSVQGQVQGQQRQPNYIAGENRVAGV